MTVINNPNPIVVIDWNKFEKILKQLPKSKLIELFFEDEETCEMGVDKDVEDMTYADIISQIFLEYEEDIRGTL